MKTVALEEIKLRNAIVRRYLSRLSSVLEEQSQIQTPASQFKEQKSRYGSSSKLGKELAQKSQELQKSRVTSAFLFHTKQSLQKKVQRRKVLLSKLKLKQRVATKVVTQKSITEEILMQSKAAMKLSGPTNRKTRYSVGTRRGCKLRCCLLSSRHRWQTKQR